MRVGRSKSILFIFTNPVAFHQMPAQINTWHKARNFLYPEIQNKQQLEDGFGWVLQSPDMPGRFSSCLAGVKTWHHANPFQPHSGLCFVSRREGCWFFSRCCCCLWENKQCPTVGCRCLPPLPPQGILPWTCWDRPQLSAILCQMPQSPPWEHAPDMQDDVLLISLPLSHLSKNT